MLKIKRAFDENNKIKIEKLLTEIIEMNLENFIKVQYNPGQADIVANERLVA